MPTPSASEPLTPLRVAPAAVVRFAHDLIGLIGDAEQRVLVALSGGADSVALLLLAHAALGDRCAAATVDHGLRAEGADEARFAAGLCARLGIPHAILSGPLPARVGGSANVSARARALRYDLLTAKAERTGAAWIATAHHADDQIETAIMRLNRGSGVGGLASIRTTGWRVVRPLIGWRRAELAALVDAAGIVPVDDPTNRDARYDRARLRQALAGVDWLDAGGIAASTAALAEADEALAWTTQRLLAERTVESGDRVTLDPAGLPAELLRRLVRACIVRIDPAAAPRGAEIGRLIAELFSDRPAMLGDVLVRPGATWSFAPAPPRRNTPRT